MKMSYLRAIEKQAAWLQWLKSPHLEIPDPMYLEVMRTSGDILTYAETLYMNANFCDLVDHARRTVPDDLEWEDSWVPCQWGFLYLETPFLIPRVPGIPSATHIRAIGWRPSEVRPGCTVFITYVDGLPGSYAEGGFASPSHFTLAAGEPVLDRLHQFESESIAMPMEPGYHPCKETDELHEIRWLYTALHLMSQRLSITSTEPVSPLARSMARRKGRKLNSVLKVVSLRRMEYDRQQERGKHSDREYHWQWLVRGHWRRQPFGHGASYKNIFIEAFVKGPQNAPLKLPVRTLFVAAR